MSAVPAIQIAPFGPQDLAEFSTAGGNGVIGHDVLPFIQHRCHAGDNLSLPMNRRTVTVA
jgi:hypothetical protein